MANYKQVIEKFQADYQKTVSEGNADGYARLSSILEELDVALRENVQAVTGPEMTRIIAVLKSGKPITAQDKDLIRLWVVGDAQYYTEMEAHHGQWQVDLKQVVATLGDFSGRDLDVKEISGLRGVLRDAGRILDDIFYFTEQKERVVRFLDSTADIDPQEREILARVLEQKLKLGQF